MAKAKAKDTAKEAPKARTSKAKEKAAEKALLAGALTEAPAPMDAEARKTRLKNLIKLGKERGYLTYAEINDHLPDDVVDAESIETIISTFSDMSIQVFDEAPAAEDLLMSDAAAATTDDDEVEEQAEQALSTVDSEFGRTTDPVRMYMREMGSVELLTREGEIEIAKRIEDGLKHMVQAISACPTTIADIIDMAAKIESDEMRIDELVDGLIDPNAVEAAPTADLPDDIGDETDDEGDEDGGAGAVSASLLQLKTDALERFNAIKALHVKTAEGAGQQGLAGQDLPQAPAADFRRADEHPLHLALDRTPVRQRARHGRNGPQVRAQDPADQRREGQDAASALHPGLPGQ